MRMGSVGSSGEAAASFAAIHLLHDPHTIGEKLFTEVRKQGERFEVRLMMLNLLPYTSLLYLPYTSPIPPLHLPCRCA